MTYTLVTGGGGFLGRYIVEQLVSRGDPVRVFSRRRYDELTDMGVEMVQGDIRDRHAVAAACNGIETVFHVAGVAGIWGPWRHYYEINTLGTINLVTEAIQNGVQRLVYTSSPSVTFDGLDQEGVDETAPYSSRWLCHYPHSKALAEKHVLKANGRNNMVTCALRPHLIWGPRDQHLIPRLLDRARQGKLRRIGDGSNRVDMVYVENAAAAHLQAADQMVSGTTLGGKSYFISQGEPVNCWQWIDEILALAGIPPVDKSVSLKTAWCIGHVLEVIHRILRLNGEPPMTRFLAAQLATTHYFDITRAQKDFGYRPSISTQEGMRRLAERLNPDS